jgi:ABC-2 type transport system permease protein
MPVIQLIQFPMLFLSGIFFPVEILPDFMKPVVNALPLSYLGDGLRQVMVEASPVFSLNTDFLVLGGWLLLSLVVSVRFFRWE